jgi:hypothetical protein
MLPPVQVSESAVGWDAPKAIMPGRHGNVIAREAGYTIIKQTKSRW